MFPENYRYFASKLSANIPEKTRMFSRKFAGKHLQVFGGKVTKNGCNIFLRFFLTVSFQLTMRDVLFFCELLGNNH